MHGNGGPIGDSDFRAVGEKGRDVGVRPDAEKTDVEARPRAGFCVIRRREASKLCRVGFGGGLGGVRAVGRENLMHVLGRRIELAEQRLTCLQGVPIRVGLGYVAFVAPPEMHARPVHESHARLLGDRGKNGDTGTSTRERHVHDGTLDTQDGELLDHASRDDRHDRVPVSADDDATIGEVLSRHAAPG